MKKLVLFFVLAISVFYGISVVSAATCDHTEVKKIIHGPVGPGDYNDVCIKSNSVGVKAFGTTYIENSVIEAQTCVEYDSFSALIVNNNMLDCNTGIWFVYGKKGNYYINNNLYTGDPEN